MGRSLWVMLLAATVAATVAAAGCSDSGPSEADRQELADLVLRLANTNGFEASDADIDFYMEHITDRFVQVFGTESVAACRENATECIGDPIPNPTVDVDDVDIDGDSATLPVVGEGLAFNVGLVREDDVWKADTLSALSDEIPSGVESLDVSMVEFAFAFDTSSEVLASGSVAFRVKNDGAQPHEIVVLKLPDGTAVLDALTAEEEPEGMEFLGAKLPFQPGDEANFVLRDLATGHYALVCFFPDTDDPEGTPHAFKGMTAEFDIP